MTQAENNCLGQLIERIDNLIRRVEDHMKEDKEFREDSAKDRKELHRDLLEVRTQFNLCQSDKAQRLSASMPWIDRWRSLLFNLMQVVIILAASAIWAHLFMAKK